MRRKFSLSTDTRPGLPGFISYLMIGLWFLLTILATTVARADAAEPATLTAADILPDIEEALTAKGMPAGAEIALADPDQAFVATDDVRFSHVSYNALSGRFVLRLADIPLAITGTARIAESFPVLTHALARGDIVSEADIAYIDSAEMRAGDFVRDAKDLIGKEARRPLPPQTPLRPGDVLAPTMVEKGAVVTLAYAVDGLRLTHQGVALSSGSEGDVISIRNMQSDRVLKGVIAGANLVRITPLRAPAVLTQG